MPDDDDPPTPDSTRGSAQDSTTDSATDPEERRELERRAWGTDADPAAREAARAELARRDLERRAWGSGADPAAREAARSELASLAAPERPAVPTTAVPFDDDPAVSAWAEAAEPSEQTAEDEPHRRRAVGFALLAIVAALAVVGVSASLVGRGGDDERTVSATDVPTAAPTEEVPDGRLDTVALDIFTRAQISADLPDPSRVGALRDGTIDVATVRLIDADGDLVAYAARQPLPADGSTAAVCLIVVGETAAGTNCQPDAGTFRDAGRLDVYWDDGSGTTGASWTVDGAISFSHPGG